QDRSRCAAPIAEIEMISTRIIEIDGAFDEMQAEKSHVKIERPLRITRDRSHMMESDDFSFHIHDISTKSLQFRKIFGMRIPHCDHGPASSSFRVGLPMSTNAMIPPTIASVAPIAMMSLKACTKDSAIACPIICLVIGSNSSGMDAAASLLR